VIGYYSLILAIVTWAGLLKTAGLKKSVEKRVSEGEDKLEFINAALLISLFLTVLLAILIYIFQSNVNSYTGYKAHNLIILLLFITSAKSIIVGALKGSHLVHLAGLLSSGRQALRGFLQILFISLGLGVTGLIFGYVIAALLVILLGLYLLEYKFSFPSRKNYVSLIGFAKYAWLGNTSKQAFNSLDIIILGLFVSPGLIGIYTVAWSLGTVLKLFGSAVSSTMFPEMSKTSHNNGVTEVTSLVRSSLSYSGIFLIPGLFGTILIGDLILGLYGDGFIQGHNIFVILVSSLLVYNYNSQLVNTLNSINRPDLAFKSNLVLLISNFILNFLLIYRYGWLGAAFATLISSILAALSSYIYLHSEISVKFPSSEIGYQIIAASLMAYSLHIKKDFILSINLPLEFLVLALVAISSLIYVVSLAILWKDFKDTVINNIFEAIGL